MTSRSSLSFEPKLERLCEHCRRGEGDHNATTKTCPLGDRGRGGYSQFHATRTFSDSGKHTIKSKRAHEAWVVQEQRRKDSEEANARELAKVRAMTYEEVITAAVELITKVTGLCVVVERDRDWQAEIHICNPGDTVRLGYTTVTKSHLGGYLVGGTSSGCFMSNHDDKCLSRVMAPHFKALEEKANEEKV